MSKNIALFDAKFFAQTAADFQNMGQTIPSVNRRFVERDRIWVNFGNTASWFDKNHIEGNQCVPHPKRQRLRALIHKEHPRQGRHAWSVHQADSTLLRIIGDFDPKCHGTKAPLNADLILRTGLRQQSGACD